MSALIKYNILLIVIFLICVGLNISFYSSYIDDVCTVPQPDNTDNSTNSTDTGVTNNNTPADFTAFPLVIGLFYVGLAVCTLVITLLIWKYEGMAAHEFGNLGTCWACLGCFVRKYNDFVRLVFVAIIIMCLI
jgi:hypothetical protein